MKRNKKYYILEEDVYGNLSLSEMLAISDDLIVIKANKILNTKKNAKRITILRLNFKHNIILEK